MKKKLTRTTAKKTIRRPVKRTSTPSANQSVLFQRIVIISACVVLVLVGAILLNKRTVTQSVAGTSIMKGLFMQANVTLPATPGAVSYNIYYKQTNESRFTNAVRKVSPAVRTYTISHLKKGVTYQYRISALGTDGKEYGWTETKPLTNLRSM